METLCIDETNRTPRVELNTDGNLSLIGRSLPKDSSGFFIPVLNWIKEVTAPRIHFLIHLEYINTNSAKHLFIIFQLLKDNCHVKTIQVDWYYEDDDEDSYEMGHEFESLINIPFTYIALSEVL